MQTLWVRNRNALCRCLSSNVLSADGFYSRIYIETFKVNTLHVKFTVGVKKSLAKLS